MLEWELTSDLKIFSWQLQRKEKKRNVSRLHAFYALLYLCLIPSSSSFGHQGAPFTREFHPPPRTITYSLRRNVHVGVQFCIDSLVFSSFFVFSHDKQETEEVVQLQEGGGLVSCNPVRRSEPFLQRQTCHAKLKEQFGHNLKVSPCLHNVSVNRC